MKKYNLSEIMHKAWKLYRKGVSSFAEALHRAWNSAKAAPVNARLQKAAPDKVQLVWIFASGIIKA